MFYLLSPAKSLNKTPIDYPKHIQTILSQAQTPSLVKQTEQLIKLLQTFQVDELQSLYDVSTQIAQLNWQRFNTWQNLPEFLAIYGFAGDVYQGLNIQNLNLPAIQHLAKYCGILSGLYGLIHPLELIKPYRLEMGTQLKIDTDKTYKNLYAFWQTRVTQTLASYLQNIACKSVVNLASQEYAKVIDIKALKALGIEWVDIVFEQKNAQGVYKQIGIKSKYARGLMAKFMAENSVSHIEELKKFDLDGYQLFADRIQAKAGLHGQQMIFRQSKLLT